MNLKGKHFLKLLDFTPEEIEGLIGEYWGTEPIYYIDSKNEEEAGAAKLCCKILEAIRIAQRGEK